MPAFKDGDSVHQLMFMNDEYIAVGHPSHDHRLNKVSNVQKIVVVIETNGVPWFEVYIDGEVVSKWNGALVEGVVP